MGPATMPKESVFQLMSCLLLVVLFLLVILLLLVVLFLFVVLPGPTCGITSSCGTNPSRGITPSCGATSIGVDGLPPPVRGRIYSPRDEPVPSHQANTAHASESATINPPATAPTAAPIAPSALAATRLRDTHGPVAPPDPP